jgi:hypothetical protein
MKTKIETVEGHDVFLEDDGRITYTAKAAIDADGNGPSLRDPDFQGDTSRHFEHRPLDATKSVTSSFRPQSSTLSLHRSRLPGSGILSGQDSG